MNYLNNEEFTKNYLPNEYHILLQKPLNENFENDYRWEAWLYTVRKLSSNKKITLETLNEIKICLDNIIEKEIRPIWYEDFLTGVRLLVIFSNSELDFKKNLRILTYIKKMNKSCTEKFIKNVFDYVSYSKIRFENKLKVNTAIFRILSRKQITTEKTEVTYKEYVIDDEKIINLVYKNTNSLKLIKSLWNCYE